MEPRTTVAKTKQETVTREGSVLKQEKGDHTLLRPLTREYSFMSAMKHGPSQRMEKDPEEATIKSDRCSVDFAVEVREY